MKLQLAQAPRCIDDASGRSWPLAPRDAALLAWLAIEGRTPRPRLAALLWPDSTVEAARNALRQRLFQLRRQVDAELVAGSAQLELAPGVAHDLDDADEILGSGAGHDIGPAIGVEFEAWLARVRAQRGERQRARLLDEAAAAERERDGAAMLVTAQRLLALDPLREESHRLLMRTHYLRGDRAAALQAFDHCERLLKNELGAAPSAETLALLATIDAVQPAVVTTTSVSAAVPASLLLPPLLIGRDAERTQLEHAWAAGQVVALIGEAGLGKTRLLQAFAQRHRGAMVGAAGRPGDAGVPFATLARLLRAVMQRDHAAPLAQRLPDDTRHEIARVLPEFETSPALRPSGEGQRLVMERALRSLLQAQPGLAGLWVDDLHFADEASLEMLRALIDDGADDAGDDPGGHQEATPPADPAVRLRWVIAYRPAEAGTPVQALHDALVEHARLTPIALRPLDEPALAALVDSLGLPGVSGRALAPGLARRTGGNPLFVLETLKQAWAERRLARLADAASLPRPLSVGRLIERRIAQLSAPALALARVASIAGPDFSIAMAEHVLQAPALAFADAFNELETAQVMRGSAFAHDLVFDAVRASVPAPIAAHTHARVAGFLEPRGAEAARIAAHWIAAEQPERALPWLAQAADQARLALRVKEYIGFMERKSAIEAAAGHAEAAFDSLMLAAEAFVRVDRDPALGLAWCERLEQLAATPAQRIDALLQRSNFEMEAVQMQSAVQHARSALHESLRLGDARLTALSRLQLAAALTIGDQLSEAAEHYQACMAWVDAHGSADQRCELHGDFAMLCDNLGRLEEAAVHHELCCRHARDSGNLSNHAVALGNLACNRIDAGDLEAARTHLLQGLQITASHDGFGAGVGTLHVLLSLVSLAIGRYDEALDRSQLAVDAMTRYAGAYPEAALLRQAQVWQHLGQWARVQQLLDRPAVRESTKVACQVSAAILQHHLDAALGRPRGDGLVQALRLLPEHERPDLRLPLLIEHAATLTWADALRQLDAVIGRATTIQHRGTLLAAHVRAAGLAAEAEPARAARHADEALRLAERCGSTTLQRAELWWCCGRALLAHGQTERANALFRQGQAWVRQTAQERVPASFRDSFLHRNVVNAALMRAAARLPG